MKSLICLFLVAAIRFNSAASALMAAGPILSLGSVSGKAGAAVTLPVSFTPGSTGVAAFQFSIVLPNGWTITSAAPGPAASASSKIVNLNRSNGELIVFGVNQNNIPSGIVTNVQVNIPSSTAAGSYPLKISGAIFSSSNGSNVPGSAADGSIVVGSGASSVPVISSFNANPASISAGSASSLTWNVTGASTISISPGVGVVAGTSVSVHPTTTTTYTLTATNSLGSSTRTAIVSVVGNAPTIASFSANPTSISAGGASSLTWNVTGASTISISPGVGAVTGSSVSVHPTTTTTYTLTATNSRGSSTRTATVSVAGNAPTIASFGARPASIKAGGYSSLVWSVTGANSLSISPGVGPVTGTGVVVTPTVTTTYTLTATSGASSVTAKTTVTVTP